MLKLLGNKNFSLYFFGRLISNIAQYSVLFVGALYIVDTLGSASYQGMFSSFVVLLQVLAYPLAIVLTKSWKKIRVMYISDILSSIILFSGATILLLNNNGDPYSKAITLALIAGGVAINITFFNSSSSGVIPYVVKDKDYAKAQSFMAFILTTSAVLGLILSGILYELFGVETTLYVMASLYLISAITETFIKLENEEVHDGQNTKNPFKLYGKSLKETKRVFFNGGNGSRLLLALTLSAILISGYHQVISPFLVKIHLGYTGEEGTYWLTIFKSMTMIGSMIGSLLLPHIIKKKFGHKGVLVSIFLEFPFQVLLAMSITFFDLGYIDAYYTVVLASGIMLMRTMFGNIRMAAGRIGMDQGIKKKDIMIYNTNFRFMFSIIEVPTFIIMGIMLDVYGLAIVLYGIAALSLLFRITSWFIVKDVKYLWQEEGGEPQLTLKKDA